MTKGRPPERAASSCIISVFWPRRAILTPFFSSFFLIHVMPCSCGSIISGQRAHDVTIAPFSTETRSVGRFSDAQIARCASVVSMLSGSAPDSDMGHAALGRGDRAREVGHVGVVLQREAEALREAARVGDEGRREQHVARQDLELRLQRHDRRLPARALRAERRDEAVGEAELALARLALGDDALLLGDGGRVLRLELRDGRLRLGLLGERRLLGGDRLVELVGRRGGRHALRLDRRVDVPVDGDVEHKVGQARRGRRLLGHRLDVEVLLGDQRPDVLEVLGRHLAVVDALLVVEQRVEEGVDVLHHALLAFHEMSILPLPVSCSR